MFGRIWVSAWILQRCNISDLCFWAILSFFFFFCHLLSVSFSWQSSRLSVALFLQFYVSLLNFWRLIWYICLKRPKLQGEMSWDDKLCDLRCCKGLCLQSVMNAPQKTALLRALGRLWKPRLCCCTSGRPLSWHEFTTVIYYGAY